MGVLYLVFHFQSTCKCLLLVFVCGFKGFAIKSEWFLGEFSFIIQYEIGPKSMLSNIYNYIYTPDMDAYGRRECCWVRGNSVMIGNMTIIFHFFIEIIINQSTGDICARHLSAPPSNQIFF